jgi:hypothetical protein
LKKKGGRRFLASPFEFTQKLIKKCDMQKPSSTSKFNQYMRQAWPVLWEAIGHCRTVSYTELAGRAGRPLHHRHIHRQLLREMSLRCRKAGLPDLAALVVRKDSGRPGSGWYDLNPGGERLPDDPQESWAEALTICLNYEWRILDIDRLTTD